MKPKKEAYRTVRLRLPVDAYETVRFKTEMRAAAEPPRHVQCAFAAHRPPVTGGGSPRRTQLPLGLYGKHWEGWGYLGRVGSLDMGPG